jgi:hypothetical protein
MFSAIRSYRGEAWLPARDIGTNRAEDRGVDRGLFIQAQGEYLRGNWSQAEAILKQSLQFSRQDVEARLLLATLLRRAKRLDEARLQLDQTQRFDECGKWNWEIQRERQLQRRLESNAGDTTREGVTGVGPSVPSSPDE